MNIERIMRIVAANESALQLMRDSDDMHARTFAEMPAEVRATLLDELIAKVHNEAAADPQITQLMDVVQQVAQTIYDQGVQAASSLTVLDGLEILKRTKLAADTQGTAAHFLTCIGKADMWVIANPLVKRSTSDPARQGNINAERSPLKIGGRYNWKNQSDRMAYLGRNWSGNGYWHQFEKVGEPGVVWCEVLDSDLHMIEETAAENEL